MQNLTDPLNDEELDHLDRFLLDRIDEEIDTDGKDEGVLNISELDGFFTAIISAPASVMPSRWLPAVWGDYAPVWEDEKAFEAIVTLLMRHMNGIASHLIEEPETFEPLFLERVVKGKTYTIVDDWCEGYVRGVALTEALWETGGVHMTVLLAPIRAFTSATGWYAHEQAKGAEVDNIRNAITPNVREIHAYWFARRDAGMPATAPTRRAEPRVGRNDPCPCGSGKKYKHCCLH